MPSERTAGRRERRSGRTNTPTRRQLLASVGVAATAVLAGCTEGQPGGGESASPDPTDSAPDDESDDGSDPADSDGSGSTTRTDPAMDGPAGTDTATATETEVGTDTPGETAGGTATATAAGCDDVVPDVTDSVAIEATMEHPEDGTVEVTGRTHGDDQYYEFVHSDGTVLELYIVEEEYYTVSEQGCFKFGEPPENGYASPEEEFSEDEFWEGEDPDGTEVIDGEEMVVYEFDVQTSHYDYELTVYVQCATGRIYRADQFVPSENVSTVAYYDNWGDTDPVSPPEMDCQEV